MLPRSVWNLGMAWARRAQSLNLLPKWMAAGVLVGWTSLSTANVWAPVTHMPGANWHTFSVVFKCLLVTTWTGTTWTVSPSGCTATTCTSSCCGRSLIRLRTPSPHSTRVSGPKHAGGGVGVSDITMPCTPMSVPDSTVWVMDVTPGTSPL